MIKGVKAGRAFGPIDSDELQRLGRFAGVLLVVGALVSFPAGLVLESVPAATDHLIGVAALTTGLIALCAPWQRMSPNWLHFGAAAATIEIAAGVAVFSDDYAFFYVLVAMFAAYAIRDRDVLIVYMAVLTVALLSPLVYEDEELKEQAHHILVTFPVMLIAAAIVRYLRDTLEQRENQFRRFAFEAVSLAERIRGLPPEARVTDKDLAARLGRLAEGAPAPQDGD
jgi:uncharacterized membrane protein HdeD (DUF308 family)